MSGKMRFVGIVALLALLCGLAFGQAETGSVFGTVTDPQGAVVSGAKVTVKSSNTNAERSTMTNSNGLYTFTNLPPGPYDVKVEAANFAPAAKRLDVGVGSRNTVDFPLAITGGSTIVEVVGEGGVAINTTSQELGATVTGQQITELPTLTRNAYSLVGTAGNVSGNSAGRGAGVSINGQRDASTDILLDGGENVDLFTSSIGQDTPLDSVGEFKVITSNFSAEYGRASGGVVNVSTKGGTNAFHGSVFEFYRGAGMASNTYDNNANGIDKPNFVRNQFGYSIGGPIMKDKLFFFSNTEWIRVRSNGSEQAWIVDPAFITGSTAAATQAFYSTYGALKPGLTTIDTCIAGDARCGTVSYDRVSYNVPSNAGGGDPRDEYQNVERVDFNFTDKTTMYGRYALQSINFFPGTVSSSPYLGYDTGQTTFNNNILFNLTHIWSPNVVTQSKVVFNRLNTVQPLNGPGIPTLDWRATGNQGIDGIGVAGPGYLPGLPGSGIPFGGPQNLYQFYQDLSWTKGKHQFRFGGQYIHTRDNRVFGAYETAVEALGTGLGSSNTNLINGQLRTFQTAVDPQGKFPCATAPVNNFTGVSGNRGTTVPISTPGCQLTLPATQPRFDRANRYHDFAFYAQDSWKLMPRFTLNLGVRWEYYGVQHNNDPSFDSNFYLGTGANYPEQVRNGQVFTSTDPNNPVGGLWEPDYNNWAPRVGFAWDLFGNGKTSLRGGYGISYERNFGNVTFNVIQNPPNYAVVAISTGDTGCTPCTITTDNFGPFGGGPGTKDLAKTSLRAPKQNIATSYAHFWSLALEREVAKNTVMALEYSGSRGVKQYTIENPNRQGAGSLVLGDNPTDQGTCLNASCSAFLPGTRRLNDQYTGFNRRGDAGSSSYNALNVRVQTSNLMNSGLSFVSNYTWAHSNDISSSTFSEFGNDFNLGLLNTMIPSEDKGDSNFDIRHRWVMSGTWDTPWFKSDENWVKKNVLGGWTFAPIVSVQSGNPFSVWDCLEEFFNVCPRYFYGSHPNTSSHDASVDIGGNTFNYITIDPNQYIDYFNPVVGTGEWGVCGVGEGATNGCPFPSNMSGRNSFRAPGVWNMDLGIYKNFHVTERFTLQFRSEFYNVMNHSNLYVQGGSAEADNTSLPFFLGQCTSEADCPAAATAKRGGFGNANDERRNVQFGLRLIF
jgi:hypothetical protein